MCVNYITVSRQVLYDVFDTSVPSDEEWREELYRDYLGPIIVHDDGGKRAGLIASYSMVPKRHLPAGTDFSTMNARDNTIGKLKSYKPFWNAGQLCLVPMLAFFEPNWEQKAHVRWKIGMADASPFAVAGLYREWKEQDGNTSFAFTQLTINADDHPLMQRFHRPGAEKRSLVIVPRAEYDEWLSCKDPERARTWLQPYPAELMRAEPAPKPKDARPKEKSGQIIQPTTRDLF
ncbi:MAG: SOS response-associated peptidase family protein [Oxalobacteraceae bacterium]